ncbi:MAG: HepT-like ribonuclease domain-containing protein [Nitrospirota bacterium]
MPAHKDLVRLRHMLDHAREAVAMVRGRSRADIDADRQLNLALVRLIEIVGEAAARTTERERGLYPDIPWLEIIGLRNRLIHGYDSVDFDILWNVITRDLPPLIEKLERGIAGNAS